MKAENLPDSVKVLTDFLLNLFINNKKVVEICQNQLYNTKNMEDRVPEKKKSFGIIV